MPHKALFLLPDGVSCEYRTILQHYHPSPGHSLLAVHYSGINPADIKHSRLGMVNLIPGYDFAGTIVSTSPDSAFQPGDLVAGTTPTGISREHSWGSHQDFLLATDSMMFKIPATMPMHEAAGLTITTRTAIVGLYGHLHLPFPWAPGAPGPILIWGGASSVGSAAIQLAKASGCDPIYTTASPENHTMLWKLGATRCFDYKDPAVLGHIQTAVTESRIPLHMAYDTIGPSGADFMSDNCLKLESSPAGRGGNDKVPFVNAMPDWDADINVPGVGPMVVAKDAEMSETMSKVLDWVVREYGTGFVMPRVRLVAWKDAVGELTRSMKGENSGEKTVVDHHRDREG